jgi:hypothetical protein
MNKKKEKIEINITDFLIFFDDLLPQTPEEELEQKYTFVCKRDENSLLYLYVSLFERYATISLKMPDKFIRLLEFKHCRQLRALNDKRSAVEIYTGSQESPESIHIKCTLHVEEKSHWIEIDADCDYEPVV